MERTKKEILIIGADGLLGKALAREMSPAHNILGTALRDLDITDGPKVNELCRQICPKIIILTAAYTDVDGCEDNVALAHRVNAKGARNVAQAAKTTGAVLIFMSTDYVFDGEKESPYQESDEPRPISVYGRSKLQGEKAIESVLENFIIIRSSWLFGEGKRGFVQAIIEALREKKPLKIVSDKWGSPTYVVDLSRAMSKLTNLILKEEYDFKNGHTVHITNSGVCSWFDIAEHIAKILKFKATDLNKTSLAEYSFKARRPRYSALDNSRYNKMTASPLRPWQEAMKEFLECQKS